MIGKVKRQNSVDKQRVRQRTVVAKCSMVSEIDLKERVKLDAVGESGDGFPKELQNSTDAELKASGTLKKSIIDLYEKHFL